MPFWVLLLGATWGTHLGAVGNSLRRRTFPLNDLRITFA